MRLFKAGLFLHEYQIFRNGADEKEEKYPEQGRGRRLPVPGSGAGDRKPGITIFHLLFSIQFRSLRLNYFKPSAMDWILGIQPKIKAAFLLAVICLLVLLGINWVQNNLESINNSCSSIYQDRLLPATYVFQLTDHFYQKRLTLETCIQHEDGNRTAEYLQRLEVHNTAMDSLIHDFETTYLVEVEDRMLRDFKQGLDKYNQLERRLLETSSAPTQQDADYRELIHLFGVAKEKLTLLSHIQTDVGYQIKEHSQATAYHGILITKMELALILIISFIIQALILASKAVIGRLPQRHELN